MAAANRNKKDKKQQMWTEFSGEKRIFRCYNMNTKQIIIILIVNINNNKQREEFHPNFTHSHKTKQTSKKQIHSAMKTNKHTQIYCGKTQCT